MQEVIRNTILLVSSSLIRAEASLEKVYDATDSQQRLNKLRMVREDLERGLQAISHLVDYYEADQYQNG